MAPGASDRSSRATDPPAAARANASRRDYAFVVLVTVMALGFFLGQYLVVSALSGRMDMLEKVLLEQGNRCAGAQVVVAPTRPPAPVATGTETVTAEPAVDASAAPTSKPTKDLSY